MSGAFPPLVRSALWLGIAGLLPCFFLAALAGWRLMAGRRPVPLVAYGAVILAFVRGAALGIALMLSGASDHQRSSSIGAPFPSGLPGPPSPLTPVESISPCWSGGAFRLRLPAFPEPAAAYWYLPLRLVLTLSITAALLAGLVFATAGRPPAAAPFLTGTEA